MSWHIKRASAGAPISGERQQLNSNQRRLVIRPKQSVFVKADSKRPKPKRKA